jgi:hypothetical protein
MAEEQSRPPRRPFGRSWSDFQPTEAEKKLAEAARTGEVCVLGEQAPDEGAEENTIRAGFLRFLALGGDETAPVYEKGVRLKGAFIEGQLDLEGVKLPFDLLLWECCFDAPITLRSARCRTISLDGSRVVGFDGDRLQLDGSLFLRQVHATGEIRLLGARIANDLDCGGGRFKNEGGIALFCDSAEIGGNIFLNRDFHATGVTNLFGARITGQLDCTGGRFENAGGLALGCDNAKISGGLLFRGQTSVQGAISFAHAEVATLGDDPSLWPENSLHLEGFRYQRITSTSPLDAKTRIAWLYKQQREFLEGENFALQPWMHLAKVMREQGHFRDAAEVDISRENLLRRAGRIAVLPAPRRWWAYFWTPANPTGNYDTPNSTFEQAKLLPNIVPWVLHWFYGVFAAYGHKPIRVLYVAVAIWFCLGAFYDCAGSKAAFGPSNALVYQNPVYEHCRPEASATPANGKAKIGNWTKCPNLPGEYTSFSALAYSLDLILPVVGLSQANDWTPITSGDEWTLGYVVRIATWFEEIFGWVAALTLAAIASGLVKRRDGE